MTTPSLIESEEPVHEWFGLSYSQYQVLNRTVLQSMPLGWQRQFVALIKQLEEATADLPSTSYRVTPGQWAYPGNLSAAQLDALGWAYNEDQTEICDAQGEAHHPSNECVFVEGTDPLPPYQRGRTRVPLRSRVPDAYVHPRFGHRAEVLYRGPGASGEEIVLIRNQWRGKGEMAIEQWTAESFEEIYVREEA